MATDPAGTERTQAESPHPLHQGEVHPARRPRLRGFHRYIYKPYRAGAFRKGASGRTSALVKGGAAGLFVATQLRAMRQDALSDDTLRPIANKIGGLIPAVALLASALKGGTLDPTGLTNASSSFDGIVSAAQSAGVNIPLNKSPSIP